MLRMFFGSNTLVHRTYALARLSPSRSSPISSIPAHYHRLSTGTATTLLDDVSRRMQLSESLHKLFSVDLQLQ
ncbi:hypothetical protein SVAN01_01054 [Stagonosporopsis vannaccii]|nr:hypothetical protein SVAN01_01054 [Stagonosporopsis vannaccii]